MLAFFSKEVCDWSDTVLGVHHCWSSTYPNVVGLMIQPWPGEEGSLEMLMPMQVFHSLWMSGKGAPEDSERSYLYLLLDKWPVHCKERGANVGK